MARGAVAAQSQRSLSNPLVLGTFSTLSLRYLRGSLGPKNQVIGRADTRSTSNGGYGGGSYNHWFRINVTDPAWIIVTKGPPRPDYIQVSVYDLNQAPIKSLPIFDADSIESGLNQNGEVYIPYLDTVMSTPSDLYNTYNALRLDRGDERYYPVGAGGYLLCISTTRNEPLNYEVGLVVEFPITELFWGLEDDDGSVALQETDIIAPEIESPVTADYTIDENVNAFSEDFCAINSGVTVTISEGAAWLIGQRIPIIETPNFKILLEPVNEEYFNSIHDHSLSEWKDAWNSQHQDTDRFPEIFAPLTNRD